MQTTTPLPLKEPASRPTSKQELWRHAKQDLKDFFPKDIFETWFAPIQYLESNPSQDVLELEVPNEFALIWIQDNYIDFIVEKVAAIAGYSVQVLITAEKSIKPEKQSISAPLARPKTPTKRRQPQVQLNPQNTFDHFVIGSSNQMAHAAAMAVGQAPGKAYNPLFLYGETGLGKTHLLHSIGHCALAKNKDLKVAYISCEKFTNEFIRAIQENSLIKFRRYYRSIDLLLIDDIHFLAGKERIQEEFFHTFNELYESQSQICLTSDRPAGEIARLASRLISRFQWGLVTDIQAPDYETRLAIVRKKAAELDAPLPGPVLEFIAQHISRNVRRLEGSLNRVASYATFTSNGLDIPTVERLLQDILQEEAQNRVTVEKIQKRVVDYYRLRLTDMVSRRRPSNIVLPRQIAMYLSRTLTQHSLQEIGEAFGGRDHGTVIHACKTIDNIMEQDNTVKREIEFLTRSISQNN